VRGLTRRRPRPGESKAAQHLPHRRVTQTGRAGDQPRPPARLAPARADDTLELARQPAWTALRSAGALKKTSETAPLLHAPRPPPPPPAVRSRGRHVERGRGSPDRLSTRDREHEPLAPGESELGVTVKAHLALLPADVWADAQPGRRAGSPPHPFTTCI